MKHPTFGDSLLADLWRQIVESPGRAALLDLAGPARQLINDLQEGTFYATVVVLLDALGAADQVHALRETLQQLADECRAAHARKMADGPPPKPS